MGILAGLAGVKGLWEVVVVDSLAFLLDEALQRLLAWKDGRFQEGVADQKMRLRGQLPSDPRIAPFLLSKMQVYSMGQQSSPDHRSARQGRTIPEMQVTPRTQLVKKRRAKPRPGRLRGEAMEALRRACFERDEYKCQHLTPVGKHWKFGKLYTMCGRCVTWESGHMAHIVSRGRGGKDEVSNVTTKCASCHSVLEHRYGKSGTKPVPRRSVMVKTKGKYGLSDAGICRLHGWEVGTQLVGDEGYGPTVIQLTAIGEKSILAKQIMHNGKSSSGSDYDSLWTLHCRDWTVVAASEKAVQ